MCLALCAALWLSTLAEAEQPQAETENLSRQQLDFFESKVRPLLVEHCYECHSEESGESNGGLLIDSAAGMRVGGVHGSTLVPGKPDESLLVRVVRYQDPKLQMPPSGKLKQEDIDQLVDWISMGAPDPRGGELTSIRSPLERNPLSHWAFNPPSRPTPPATEFSTASDPIDAHAEHRSSSAGIQVNTIAEREVLIRRLYYDLTGLPPSEREVSDFVEAKHPSAYIRLVDSLLASPEFGERYARHWLDVARYADTVGYALAGKERRYKGSERYRDWTIHAFASDMPYDEMLHHQLAADRTDPENLHGNLDAMGFLTLGRKFLNRLDVIDDRIDVITRGLMGMTVTCARCHDHKFDPIPTSDYYSIGGIIFSSEQPTDGASPLMMVDKEKPIDSPILIRGQLGNHGPIAPRQFLTALRKTDEPRFSDGSGRWELAKRITDADNPLTSRVMVNRIWGQLVGRPLVDTPSDFGFRTEPPAVPEVLDDLASEFARHWSIKRLIRRIVTTRIYRQTTSTTTEAIIKDPDNRLLARANRKRRDFESLRDSMLQTAACLDTSMGGPPLEITLSDVTPRRTIYAMIDRQNLPALFRTFDFANPDAHSPKRYTTTVPQQALFLLNNNQMFELARRTASYVRENSVNQAPETLAAAMFARVLSRQPNQKETEAAAKFLREPLHEAEIEIEAQTLWSYGTAEIDAQNQPGTLTRFPVFKNSQWQASEEFPSQGTFGYAYLAKENGHTPRDVNQAVVRRFTAPFSGQVRLTGQMGHRSDEGDGFQASIFIGEERRFHETQKKNNRPFGPIEARINAGQTVDLVASAGQSDSFDSFYWRVSLQLRGDDGRVVETQSDRHFSGPRDAESLRPLDRLAQLAQALMMSNEFAFVD